MKSVVKDKASIVVTKAVKRVIEITNKNMKTSKSQNKTPRANTFKTHEVKYQLKTAIKLKWLPHKANSFKKTKANPSLFITPDKNQSNRKNLIIIMKVNTLPLENSQILSIQVMKSM